MCSIQTMVTPDCLMSWISAHELQAFGLGQAAGDLIEQKEPRGARQSPRQLEPLAAESVERAGAAIGEGDKAGSRKNVTAGVDDVRFALARGRWMAATSRFSNTVRFSNGCGI